MTAKTEAERLACELDARVVRRWIHPTGGTPQASGYTPDPLCSAAAQELRRLQSEVERLTAALQTIAAQSSGEVCSTRLSDCMAAIAAAAIRAEAKGE